MSTNEQCITSATQYYLFSQYCENILFVLTKYSYLIFTLCKLSCNGGTPLQGGSNQIHACNCPGSGECALLSAEFLQCREGSSIWLRREMYYDTINACTSNVGRHLFRYNDFQPGGVDSNRWETHRLFIIRKNSHPLHLPCGSILIVN